MSELTNKLPESKFNFISFVVRESHFLLNEQGEFHISVNFEPKGYILKALNQFHLELVVEVREETEKFHITMKAFAVFEFDSDADIEQYKSSFFTLNAPAIAFPYIRAYISNLTTQSGLFTITLPTFNLTGIQETLKQNITELS